MNEKEILVDYFSSLATMSSEEKDLTRSIITRSRFRANDQMLFQGDVCNQIYYIVKGIVRYGFIDENGNDITLLFRAENEFITDYASFLTNTPSPNFIEAIEDIECLKFDQQGIDLIYNKINHGDRIGRKISEMLFLEASQRINFFYKATPEERYKIFLESKGDVINRVPQSYIASHIGVRPQSLSRIKKRYLDNNS
ncbi:MAG: hypothetical protein CL843_06580 [Crocinitomicaceae bacterium]|nr:hypothetical protein [Crocinitomicaceae bacterium]|tara:strand:- start:4767 stop:5357 length:591 start_codon:yes stop_codon:yes gene_type:complete